MRGRRAATAVAIMLVAGAASVVGAVPALGAPSLTIKVITWNVIGLDSNDPSVGPATFPVGVRICNEGSSAATAVEANYRWTTQSAAIALDSPSSTTLGTLAAGTCVDTYWNVTVVRAASSYQAARGYVVDATSAEGATAATPSPRELYVQPLISQNRNSVNSIIGPTSVTVGDVVTYTVDANTATNGYEQLEAFLTLPTSIFQVLRTSVTYGAPPGGTNDTMYADACGWDPVPTSTTYLSCVGPARYPGGKAGGEVISTYTVRIVGAGTTTLSSAIYDKSGASYHYNSDLGVAPNLLVVTASQPAPPTTTTTTPTTTPVSTTTTTTATVGATQQQQTTTTTTTARVAATSGGRLASTGGSEVAELLLLALGLVGLGTSALGVAGGRRTEQIPVTPLERSIHELRRALHHHEVDVRAAAAWPMLDALDRLSLGLRQETAASKVAFTTSARFGPHGSGKTIGTSTPPSA